MKRKLLSGMTALTALLAASCTSNLGLEGTVEPGSGGTGEEVEVTFSISTETATAATRAEDDEQSKKKLGDWQTVGKGHKIDMLIYAVYETEGTGYTLLTQYGKGVIARSKDATLPVDLTAGTGQTAVYDPFVKPENETDYSFTLRLMRGKEYHIAFWAQSSETDAYDTSNLENVTVSYEGLNNDETRDAFCKVETFTVGVSGSTRKIILTRPLAQINVGTTGADYTNITEYGIPSRKVAYSEITLSGVAQSMNVVTDQINATNLTDVTFKRHLMPAYMYSGTPFPEQESNDESTEETEGEGSEARSKTRDGDEPESEAPKEENPAKEEFLYVDLNQDGEIEGYKTNYPTLDRNGKPLTETFKYLSMCYVLVPATTTLVPDYDEKDTNTKYEDEVADPYNSTTLTSLEVEFAEKAEGSIAFPPLKLTNVPVHRNWRTNILGGLKWMKDPNNPTKPDDPDGPDDPDIPEPDEDPTTVFKTPVIIVDKDPTYEGEYNSTDEGETWDENQYPERPESEGSEEE